MSQLINQKFLQGIDSSKFKIAANGALIAIDSQGNQIEILKLNAQDQALVLGIRPANKADLDQAIADLTAEIAARGAADLVLSGRIDSIESALPGKASISYVNTQDGQTLDAAKLYADQKVSALVNGAPGVLDTLKEIADALGNDANLAGTLSGQIGAVQTGLANEISRATAAEAQALVDAKAYADSKDTIEANARIAGDAANLARIEALENLSVAQTIYVSKNGNDTTGTGGQHKPFLTIAKAFSMITDASPSKRYVVRVAAGAYTETAVALPSNVFVIGEQKEAVRITGAVSMGAWTQNNSGSDDRSGFSMVTLLSAATLDWNAAKSRAGKLYMNEVVFASTLSLNGYDNAIAQAQFDSCVIFGAMTVSGVNVGVFSNNTCYNNITLNQHPNGGMATILGASGGYCSGTLRLNTTANDFARRCSGFFRSFTSENLIVDGPSSYADCDLVSQGKSSSQRLNGGQIVAFNPRINHDLETQMIKPLATNAHNMGDWGKQFMYNFAYVHASSGTELYLTSVDSSYDAAGSSTGYAVHIEADGYGLKPNVNGGDISLLTAAASGTGVRGKIKLDGREIDASSKKITNLASGVDSGDAVNKGQLDAVKSDLESADAAKLVEAKAYADSKVGDEAVARDAAIAVETAARQAADSALDGRVSALETAPSGPSFKYKTITLNSGSDLQYIDLDFEAKENGIMCVSLDRLMLVPGLDFSISVVGGKTRLTWINDLVSPGGDQSVEVGDLVFVSYAV